MTDKNKTNSYPTPTNLNFIVHNRPYKPNSHNLLVQINAHAKTVLAQTATPATSSGIVATINMNDVKLFN